MTDLNQLTRYRDRGRDRAELDGLLDEVTVGVLSTVVDGMPWSVPLLFARSGDEIILHGSSGAGALRHVAAGVAATFTVFSLDALIVADTLFDHSANYRSAVIRGQLRVIDDEAVDVLTIMSDKLIPGRSREVPAITAKERAATLALSMHIGEDNWLCKARSGGPSSGSGVGWTGVVPIVKDFGEPQTYSGKEVPESVRRLSNTINR